MLELRSNNLYVLVRCFPSYLQSMHFFLWRYFDPWRLGAPTASSSSVKVLGHQKLTLQLWLMSLTVSLFGAGPAEHPGCLPCWLICCTTIVMGTICVEDSEYCGGCLDDIDVVLWCSPTHRLIQTGSDKLKQQLSSRQNLMVPTRCAVAAKCTFVQ